MIVSGLGALKQLNRRCRASHVLREVKRHSMSEGHNIGDPLHWTKPDKGRFFWPRLPLQKTYRTPLLARSALIVTLRYHLTTRADDPGCQPLMVPYRESPRCRVSR